MNTFYPGRFDHWRPIPHEEHRCETITTASIMLTFMKNVGPFWNDSHFQYLCNHQKILTTLRDMVDVLDQREWDFLDGLADEDRWNKENLEKAAILKPRLLLDATRTTPGNLTITVHPHRGDWLDFHEEKGFIERPHNELVYIRNGGLMTYAGSSDGHYFNDELGNRILQDLSAVAMKVWRTCVEETAKRFDTTIISSFEPVVTKDERSYSERIAGLLLLTPQKRVQRDLELRKADEARQLKWAKEAAEKFIKQIGSCVEAADLALQLDEIEAAKRPRKHLIEAMTAAGVKTSYQSLDEHRAELLESLATLQPQWRIIGATAPDAPEDPEATGFSPG